MRVHRIGVQRTSTTALGPLASHGPSPTCPTTTLIQPRRLGGLLSALTAILILTLLGAGSASAATRYDAVFRGDPTGSTDVTASLARFLQSHDGQRVALAHGASYRVSGLVFTARNLTVDFRGARLLSNSRGAPVLRIQTSTNVTLNRPWVVGTGYQWIPSIQWEHGIYVDGGAGITLNHPITRNTHGDGIYVGMFHDGTEPARSVVIRSPDIRLASRSGIAPVAGEVSIHGGRIYRVGMHAINFEVNVSTGARSIRGVVDGVDIRRYGDLPIDSGNYAVAALGWSTAIKPSMVIQNLTGDQLRITVGWTADVVVRNNVSDTASTATFPGCDSVTFAANTRIKRG